MKIELKQIEMILPLSKYSMFYSEGGDVIILKRFWFWFKLIDCIGIGYEFDLVETEKKDFYIIYKKTKANTEGDKR